MQHPDRHVPADRTDIPDHFPVTVIMERRPAQVSTWVDHVWKAIGIAVGDAQDLPQDARVDGLAGDDVRLRFHSGFRVRLFADECESYYHNLMSDTPQCYIVVHEDEDEDEPAPFLVSLSFDEAHAYLEGDDTVFAVDIPPELYRWTESFVLAHYCPQPLKKRKRRNWSDQGAGHPKQ